MRDDYKTLRALGFSDDELRELGLFEPATAAPELLVEAYLRRSKKREDLATMRQHLRDIVRYRWPEGTQIRHVWFEQLSASKAYVRRPEFEKSTAAVFDGLSKTLAFWKTDRFDRRGMGAMGRSLDEFERRRAGLVSVTEGLDSRQPGARLVFGILAERALAEARDIALRVDIGHVAHKAEGRRGPGVPPFGLTSPRLPDGKPSGLVAPHPTEYAAARRLADLLLGTWEGGAKLSGTAAAAQMNREGYTSRQGAAWTAEKVSRVVQSPLWGGMTPRTSRIMDEHGNPTGKWELTREPLMDAEGNPVRCGEGVVSAAEWYTIRSGFALRTSGTRGKRSATYLLSGTARHNDCRGPLRHHRGYYRCQMAAAAGTCAGTATRAPRLEAAVREAWVAHMVSLDPDSPVIRAIARRWLAFSEPSAQAEKVAALAALEGAQARAQRLEDDYYVHGKISEDRYEELSAALRTTMGVAAAKLEALRAGEDLTVFTDAAALREAFADADVVDQRMMLQSALRAVYVHSASGRGDQTPIEKRVSYDWVTA